MGSCLSLFGHNCDGDVEDARRMDHGDDDNKSGTGLSCQIYYPGLPKKDLQVGADAQSALRLGVSDYLLKPLRDGDFKHAGHIRRAGWKNRPPREEVSIAAPGPRYAFIHLDKNSRTSMWIGACTRVYNIREHYRGNISPHHTVAAFLFEIVARGITRGSRVLKRRKPTTPLPTHRRLPIYRR